MVFSVRRWEWGGVTQTAVKMRGFDIEAVGMPAGLIISITPERHWHGIWEFKPRAPRYVCWRRQHGFDVSSGVLKVLALRFSLYKQHVTRLANILLNIWHFAHKNSTHGAMVDMDCIQSQPIAMHCSVLIKTRVEINTILGK